ncbi:MAG: hypothetical protein ACLRZG_01250 [Streptococcus sp.]
MIEKLKHIHHMFYVGLIFMVFPFASIFLGQIPWWHFFLAIFFMMSYLGILITENKKLTWLFWIYLSGCILQEIPFLLELAFVGFTIM